MPRVLFLCTGNTCRSPLAEVFAKALGLDDFWVFESAGLQVMGRHPASDGSLKVARDAGLDLSGHRSQPVAADILADTQWVIGMTRSHAAIFRSRFAGYYSGPIAVLGAPGIDLSQGTSSPDCPEVDDPYAGDQAFYEAVGKQIRQLVQQWGPVWEGSKPEGTGGHV